MYYDLLSQSTSHCDGANWFELPTQFNYTQYNNTIRLNITSQYNNTNCSQNASFTTDTGHRCS